MRANFPTRARTPFYWLNLAGLLAVTVALAAHPDDNRFAGRTLRRGISGVGGCAIKRDKDGHIARSSTEREHLLKAYKLKATPQGCQVDHVIPLSCGGCDVKENLALLCGPVLRLKEATERKDCDGYYVPVPLDTLAPMKKAKK